MSIVGKQPPKSLNMGGKYKIHPLCT